MGESKTSISQANTLDKIGEFWDSHDFTDYDTDAPDVDFKITSVVRLDSELLTRLEEQAHRRGVRVETLVNLWLQQKLIEMAQSAA
ncbi:MAG: CopG family antitoxin [Chloroflexota bacterium]